MANLNLYLFGATKEGAGWGERVIVAANSLTEAEKLVKFDYDDDIEFSRQIPLCYADGGARVIYQHAVG